MITTSFPVPLARLFHSVVLYVLRRPFRKGGCFVCMKIRQSYVRTVAQSLLLQQVSSNFTQKRALITSLRSVKNVVKRQKEAFQDQITVDKEDLSTDSKEKPVPVGTGFIF